LSNVATLLRAADLTALFQNSNYSTMKNNKACLRLAPTVSLTL